MENNILQKILLVFITSAAVSMHCKSYMPAQTYTYVVKADCDQKDPVHIKCTYKGCVIDLSDGIDFLPETELVNSFPIIITAEHPRVSSGTVSHLERIPDVPCLWYDVSWTKEGTKTIWTIEQRADEEMPLRIPHNAVIICYPTEFVEKIEDRTTQESSTIIHLPTIVLKKNLTQAEKTLRDDGLTRSILAQLDVNASLIPTPSKLVKKGNSIKNARVK
jgi:hypothetical protein